MRTGRASATAEFVAQGTFFLSRDPRLGSVVPAGAPELAERCLGEGAALKLALLRFASSPLIRPLAWRMERAFLPGLLLHHALRKRFIEEHARAFLARDPAQLVVFGAGFDSLALRVARSRPRTSCIELDHPDTQGRKRRALGDSAPPNLELVPADLGRESPGATLSRAQQFSPGRPTFCVLEGVSMYLQEASIVRTLAAVASLGPGTRLAWTYLTPDAEGRIAFRRSSVGWVNAWLASKGEPFTWGLARPQLADFLGRCGLRVAEVADARTLRSRYLSEAQASEPLAEGEEICLCEAP